MGDTMNEWDAGSAMPPARRPHLTEAAARREARWVDVAGHAGEPEVGEPAGPEPIRDGDCEAARVALDP
jgi:hypothetical protein